MSFTKNFKYLGEIPAKIKCPKGGDIKSVRNEQKEQRRQKEIVIETT